MDATCEGSPLSPRTWLRAAGCAPAGFYGGYGRMFGMSFVIMLLAYFLSVSTTTFPVGCIDGALPWVLLAAVRWMSPRRGPIGTYARPAARLRAAFAVMAAVIVLTATVTRDLDGAMFRHLESIDGESIDGEPHTLSVGLCMALLPLVFLIAVGLHIAPSVLLRRLVWAARPALIGTTVLCVALLAFGTARQLNHPDPGRYLRGLEAIPVRTSTESVLPLGRCSLWTRGSGVSLGPPHLRAALGERAWQYPGYLGAILLDRARGHAYIPDRHAPIAIDLADCRSFTPSVRRLADDLAPPRSWIFAALFGLVAAGITLAWARIYRRTLGDPAHWRDATLLEDGTLCIEGTDARPRVDTPAPGYAGPVVLLHGAPRASSQYRDPGIVAPEDYVEGDRAQLQVAMDDARAFAEVEALGYLVVVCTPLVACLRVGLYGWP